MKLKLDLHPIHSDSHKIEAFLNAIIEEACEKRAAEVEIIPGKGSGALKKSVLRFLDRPEIKFRYHRIEKDSENWGRLFVHFRWERRSDEKRESITQPSWASDSPVCFCCRTPLMLPFDPLDLSQAPLPLLAHCPSCDSPNRVVLWLDRQEKLHAKVEPGY